MKTSQVIAAVIVLGTGLSVGLTSASAQLPPTNMGKYVHQPGDNQYSDVTQASRHGSPQMAMPVQQISKPAGIALTPAPPKPDMTLEPIAADEPIVPAGFPPLPDRLDLPVGNQGAWKSGSSFPSFAGGGSGGYDSGGLAPGMAGSGGGAPPSPTFHQHYGHVAPGAYQQKQTGSGYYKAVNPGMPSGGGGGLGYYKARSPGAAPAGDFYSTNTGGGSGPPAYTGASPRDFKALGREPKLNERQEETQAPDAPMPVVVNQATTQDLSLPEDEFSYRHPQQSAAKKFGKAAGRMITAPMNSVGGMAGVRF